MMTELISDEKQRPSAAEKVKELLAQLDASSGRAEQAAATGENRTTETITDDAPMPENVVQAVQQYESVVREVLALVGESYDELIRMDNKSPYAQAVQANPALVNMVATAANPVLAALQVALAFRPMVAFTAKYGKSPEAIKEAIRQELMAELQDNRTSKAPAAAEAEAKAQSPVFSGQVYATTATEKPAKADPLAEIYKR